MATFAENAVFHFHAVRCGDMTGKTAIGTDDDAIGTVIASDVLHPETQDQVWFTGMPVTAGVILVCKMMGIDYLVVEAE